MMPFRGGCGSKDYAQRVILRPGGEGERGRRCKHQTPSESPTGVGEHRGLVLGISPPPPEHRGTIDDASDDEDDENDEVDKDDEPPLVDIGKL